MSAESTTSPGAESGSSPLLAALLRPECYPHPVEKVRVLETHISWVLLTGDWAYKIKKPLNLGFLDFSTLELRHRFCEQELRLNRRLAPQIYEAVVEIRGTPDHPRIGGGGPVLEYAVKMREFPQEALADRILARRELGPRHIDQLADLLADFHAGAAIACPALPYGGPNTVLDPALQNFEQIRGHLTRETDREALRFLRQWTEREYTVLLRVFSARRQRGYVRECHGDLHLGNIAVIDGRPVPFDCIEFNETLRWIDVMSEVAFLVMDLEDRKRGDLAWRLLNRYLETTADYAGLEVLRFYLAYRALVRAKVHALRGAQPRLDEAGRKRLTLAVSGYLALATRFTAARPPALIITHGLPGSGKTVATQSLLELAGAVRVRSDVERKRLHGLDALARSASAPGVGIYTREATAATYDRLQSLARGIIEAGYPALVDAAFLRRAERDAFRALAATLRVPFLILACDAPEALLRERVARRLSGGKDASEADLTVLERQISSFEPLAPEEKAVAVAIDTGAPAATTALQPVIDRLQRTDPGKDLPIRDRRSAIGIRVSNQ